MLCFSLTEFQNSSTLHKMHCTLFREENGKQGRQFRLRLEYSNVELLSAYRIEWVTNKGDGIKRPTTRYNARKTNQSAAWNKNHLPAETVGAAVFAPNVHKKSSRKQNSWQTKYSVRCHICLNWITHKKLWAWRTSPSACC